MAQPVVTVTLGGTDISADVKAPEGTPSLSFDRGANFDGTAEGPGTAVIVVRNAAAKYNPANSGSSIASLLKVGKEVRVTAVYSATTYALFHGYLRRIIPISGSVTAFAELHCEDALWKYGRQEVTVPISDGRSLADYRGAILDELGETAGRRSLSAIGAEAREPITQADDLGGLDELSAIGRATGTLHFIKPITAADGYQYTTIDRNTLQSQASAETWSDTDFANSFAEDVGGFDYTDESVVNYQRVRPHLLAAVVMPEQVWSYSESRPEVPGFIGGVAGFVADTTVWLDVSGDTATVFAEFADPVVEPTLEYMSQAVTPPTVTLTAFANSAIIDITANQNFTDVADLVIRGRPVREIETAAVTTQDSASQTTYGGQYTGSPIDSELIDSIPGAEGVGAWIVYRYKDPRAKPDLTFVNRFPSQLTREVGDRITLTSSLLSLSAVGFFIRRLHTVVTASGGEWRTTYDLEAAPAVVDIFTVGGTGAQGLGGAAILGY